VGLISICVLCILHMCIMCITLISVSHTKTHLSVPPMEMQYASSDEKARLVMFCAWPVGGFNRCFSIEEVVLISYFI
jgi:hypothetical protein